MGDVDQVENPTLVSAYRMNRLAAAKTATATRWGQLLKKKSRKGGKTIRISKNNSQGICAAEKKKKLWAQIASVLRGWS